MYFLRAILGSVDSTTPHPQNHRYLGLKDGIILRKVKKNDSVFCLNFSLNFVKDI
jgi:hypothetical protein